jgi:hypothetical protein
MNSTVNANSVTTVHAPDFKPLATDTVKPCAMHSHRALINPRMEVRMHNTLHGYKRAHKHNPRQLSVTKRIHLCRLTRIAENTEESKYLFRGIGARRTCNQKARSRWPDNLYPWFLQSTHVFLPLPTLNMKQWWAIARAPCTSEQLLHGCECRAAVNILNNSLRHCIPFWTYWCGYGG